MVKDCTEPVYFRAPMIHKFKAQSSSQKRARSFSLKNSCPHDEEFCIRSIKQIGKFQKAGRESQIPFHL